MKRFFFILIISLPMLFIACKPEEENFTDSNQEEPVVFGAIIKGLGNTRALTNEEIVKDRSFNLTFRSSSGLELGKVNFNSSGIGYSIRYDNNNNPVDLIWDYVVKEPEPRNEIKYSFYLDNLVPYMGNSDEFPEGNENSTLVYLPSDPDSNPYSIGIYKGDYKSNDLIWGEIDKAEKASVENITLYHVMSRFILRLCVDNSAVSKDLVPVSAKLSNLFQTPLSFDRLTGILELPENPVSEPYSLGESINETWHQDEDITNSKIIYYTSPNFVIPPQEFLANARPRLYVTFDDGVTYSGLLPQAMNLTDEQGNSIPWTMSFKKSYIITLNVKISNDKAELQFMPATLLEWLDVGSKTILGSQAALGGADDLNNLITAFNNAKESGDTSEFYKWGYCRNDGTWIFNIFTNFGIKASEYSSVMTETEDLKYEFYIYDATVSVEISEDKEVNLNNENQGALLLKALLSQGMIP